jgi:hypothetical protein
MRFRRKSTQAHFLKVTFRSEAPQSENRAAFCGNNGSAIRIFPAKNPLPQYRAISRQIRPLSPCLKILFFR